MKCSIPQRIRKVARKKCPRGMKLSNAFAALARAFTGLSGFEGSEPARRKLPPERAKALPALVQRPPLGGVVNSVGRYKKVKEQKMSAPSKSAAIRAAF